MEGDWDALLKLVLNVLTVILVALIVIVVALTVVAAGIAGMFLVGRLVGGLFGVGALETAALALAVALGLGLLVARFFEGLTRSAVRKEDEDEDMVSLGSDEPEAPEYDDAGAAYCPNCEQRLDLPRVRPDKRRRPPT